MPREYSLSTKKEIDSLFRQGKRRYSPHFTLIFTPAQVSKFVYIVPKKNVNKASSRNYSKRIIREILRNKFLSSDIKRKHNIAILCKNNLKDLVNEKGYIFVENELLKLLQSMNFLN